MDCVVSQCHPFSESFTAHPTTTPQSLFHPEKVRIFVAADLEARIDTIRRSITLIYAFPNVIFDPMDSRGEKDHLA